MRLTLLLSSLQETINGLEKGKPVRFNHIMRQLGLWDHCHDLQKMRMARSFRKMVASRQLEGIQLLTRNQTRHALYLPG